MKVFDPTTDIKPGQIFASRRFSDKDPTMTQTLGVGGHTALVLGVRSDGSLVTLGCNRNIPDDINGLGVQEFGLNPENLKIKMLFNVKKADS